jgi:hypothetical protein
MSSKRQQKASRLNGAKSRGPVTPEGKLICSRNSLKHGLLAEEIIIDGELADRFSAFSTAHHELLQPRNEIEFGLVENIVMCRWRQKRLWVLESARMAHEIRQQAIIHESENKRTRAALAFSSLTDHSRALDSMNRYETRFDRQASRSLQRLIEIRSSGLAADILDQQETPSRAGIPPLAPALQESDPRQEKLFLPNEPER